VLRIDDGVGQGVSPKALGQAYRALGALGRLNSAMAWAMLEGPMGVATPIGCDHQHTWTNHQWRNFCSVNGIAKISPNAVRANLSDHIVDANKMVMVGSGAGRLLVDYRSTRLGAYMVALKNIAQRNWNGREIVLRYVDGYINAKRLAKTKLIDSWNGKPETKEIV
jgi:hypothetical protein